MGWMYVFIAAISEIAGTLGLTMYSKKKTVRSGAVYFGGLGVSLVFLYLSFEFLPVSVAYAVWIGIGTAGAVLLNMIFFGESKSTGRIVSVILIVIGVIGLKAVS